MAFILSQRRERIKLTVLEMPERLVSALSPKLPGCTQDLGRSQCAGGGERTGDHNPGAREADQRP
jgi:hypothetical protein